MDAGHHELEDLIVAHQPSQAVRAEEVHVTVPRLVRQFEIDEDVLADAERARDDAVGRKLPDSSSVIHGATCAASLTSEWSRVSCVILVVAQAIAAAVPDVTHRHVLGVLGEHRRHDRRAHAEVGERLERAIEDARRFASPRPVTT